jgi:hypothetical protein
VTILINPSATRFKVGIKRWWWYSGRYQTVLFILMPSFNECSEFSTCAETPTSSCIQHLARITAGPSQHRPLRPHQSSRRWLPHDARGLLDRLHAPGFPKAGEISTNHNAGPDQDSRAASKASQSSLRMSRQESRFQPSSHRRRIGVIRPARVPGTDPGCTRRDCAPPARCLPACQGRRPNDWRGQVLMSGVNPAMGETRKGPGPTEPGGYKSRQAQPRQHVSSHESDRLVFLRCWQVRWQHVMPGSLGYMAALVAVSWTGSLKQHALSADATAHEVRIARSAGTYDAHDGH